MNKKDVIGKTIVDLKQVRSPSASGVFYDFVYLELDDGTRLYTSVIELEGDYGTQLHSTRKKPKDPKPLPG